jgi:hypothetical protein
MTWTQPLCDVCYNARHPEREPYKLIEQDEERCCLCGTVTTMIVWYRIDPRTVPFPRGVN